MAKLLRAIQYKNLDEARCVVKEQLQPGLEEVLMDGAREPQGLLTVVPEDRLKEEDFLKLLDGGSGTLIQVEKAPYSGYGPPAREEDYMGFVETTTAYILPGGRASIEILECPQGARDLHHLEALILDHEHPLDRNHLARKLGLSQGWEFEDLFELILEGETTGDEVDRFIHQGIH